MRALITGLTGFVGSHLADYLLGLKYEVHGIKRWRSPDDNIRHLKQRVRIHDCDIIDYTAVQGVLQEVKPDRIYHLAAQSYVPTSWTAPDDTLTTNIRGNLNFLQAIKELDLVTRIQVAGSSEEYGLVLPEETPITEDNPLRPLSPYGVSKVAQDLLSYQYHQSYGIHVVRTRAFNHTGPRRGCPFVCSDFAHQVARIEKGLQDPVIMTGNLEAVRDFTDVRDMVRAYHLALEHGAPGEVYNIATGQGHTIQEVLDILLSLSKVTIQQQADPERLRPSDVPLLIGDCSKFRARTGWLPRIPLDQTLRDLLNYWRGRLDSEAKGVNWEQYFESGNMSYDKEGQVQT